MKAASMIRAAKETVPNDVLEFFRAPASTKDPKTFWTELSNWYHDAEERSWWAPWRDFSFPAGSQYKMSGPFVAQRFVGDADFSGTIFNDRTSFYFSTFEKDVTFARCRFIGSANFQGVTFSGHSVFTDAHFMGRADFRLAHFIEDSDFYRANFADVTSFELARFSNTVGLREAVFAGETSFSRAEIERAIFMRTTIASQLVMELSPVGKGALEFIEVGSQPPSHLGESMRGAAFIRFGHMSLSRVQLRSLDAAEVRLRGSLDIEELSLFDVDWPKSPDGCVFVADEVDLKPTSAKSRSPELFEVTEGIYTALRRNYERQGERAYAARWYVAEMEIGRKNAPLLSIRRLTRGFYKHTSYYGLSAGRAALLGLAFVLVVFLLYRIPHPAVCPVTDSGGCIGWADDLKTVLMAASLQDLPENVKLQGVFSTVLWIALKGIGAVVLGSLGVVYWKNVGR